MVTTERNCGNCAWAEKAGVQIPVENGDKGFKAFCTKMRITTYARRTPQQLAEDSKAPHLDNVNRQNLINGNCFQPRNPWQEKLHQNVQKF